MSDERICPHCGGQVSAERIICPHCLRTLPAVGAAEPTAAAQPPVAQEPAVYVPTPLPPEVAGAPRPPQGQPAFPMYQPPPGSSGPGVPVAPHDDTLSIVGLVLSILGVACCGCLPILSPVGLILSIISHTRRQTGVTWSGIIIGIIGTILFIISTIFSIYLAMHPEMQREMLEKWTKEMGLPPIPGLPMP